MGAGRQVGSGTEPCHVLYVDLGVAALDALRLLGQGSRHNTAQQIAGSNGAPVGVVESYLQHHLIPVSEVEVGYGGVGGSYVELHDVGNVSSIVEGVTHGKVLGGG